MTELADRFKQTLRNALAIGAVGGGACLLYLLVLHLLGYNPLGPRRQFDLLLQILFLTLAVYWYQRRQLPDFTSRVVAARVLRGFAVSFTANLSLALVSGVGTYLFLRWADPAVLVRHLAEAADQLNSMRTRTEELSDPDTFARMQAGLADVSAADLARDDLVRKLLLSVVVVPFSNAIIWTFNIARWFYLAYKTQKS